MSTRMERRVVAKTADYTINPTLDRPGTTFTNRGAAGAVAFTLPAPSAALKGWWYEFIVIAAQVISIATATADTLIGDNDATADSVQATRIGAKMHLFCDGTSWIGHGASYNAGAAASVFTLNT